MTNNKQKETWENVMTNDWYPYRSYFALIRKHNKQGNKIGFSSTNLNFFYLIKISQIFLLAKKQMWSLTCYFLPGVWLNHTIFSLRVYIVGIMWVCDPGIHAFAINRLTG